MIRNRKWVIGFALVGTAVALIAAACNGDSDGDSPSPAGGETPAAAGTPAAEPPSGARTLTGEGAFDWEVLEIERGVKPDLVVDAQDRVHIAYGLESRSGFVKHALVGDSAVTSTVAEGYFYFPLEIAVNAVGVTWIAYHNHDFEDQVVALAQDLEAGEWQELRTESSGHDGWDNSLALDAEGRPHTVAVDPSSFGSDVGLEYGFFGGDEWTVEEVGTGPLMYAFGTALAIDAAGIPHATYYNDESADLMYASRAGGSWTVTAVDTDGDVGRFADMLLDSGGGPHVAYLQLDGDSSGSIKYAQFRDGGWSIEEVDQLDSFFIGASGNMNGARNVISLAFDSQGDPVIAYSDQQTIKL
ncbi:MAG: hypothetical protein V3S20_04085, partial [Dehalococcoidia bacterium]